MDPKMVTRIRRLVLIAMFADDYLMDRFVLKGGAAIDLAYAIEHRESVDIDLSMVDDFTDEELEEVTTRIKRSLESIFDAEGYIIFDFHFSPSPHKLGVNQPDFWGGYVVKFKIIEKKHKNILDTDPQRAKVMSTTVNPDNSKTFKIDISKYEYCGEKEEIEFEGYTIYVYTPKMIVFEKLRAICQQMPDYTLVKRKKPRTRDFFDIYVLMTNLEITFTDNDNFLINSIFTAKGVPIELLSKIADYKSHYESGIESLKATLTSYEQDKFDFSFYFDFVLNLAKKFIPKQ